MKLYSTTEASARFRERCLDPLDHLYLAALDHLGDTCPEQVAVVNAFQRFHLNDDTADGGRGSSAAVVAAAAPSGIWWVTIPNTTARPRKSGCDFYSEFLQVSFGLAEVLMEKDPEGALGVGFGTEHDLAREPNEYFAALEFALAVGQLGFDGAVGVYGPGVPEHELMRVRTWLGIDPPAPEPTSEPMGASGPPLHLLTTEQDQLLRAHEMLHNTAGRDRDQETMLAAAEDAIRLVEEHRWPDPGFVEYLLHHLYLAGRGFLHWHGDAEVAGRLLGFVAKHLTGSGWLERGQGPYGIMSEAQFAELDRMIEQLGLG